jgi:flagellar motor switch protein FliN/FliY
MQSRFIHCLETAFGQAMGSMAGKEFTVALDEGATEAPELENAIVWQQSFSVVEGPAFWIAAGKDLWESLGRVTLEAAGVEEVADEDCRSTWHEILAQTAAGIASTMTADQAREVTTAKGAEIEAAPPGVTWLLFSVADGSQTTWQFKAAWTTELVDPGDALPQEARSSAARDSAVSRTFDLLLDVALPVAVSFGRTSLQIREVLKLNTGSIVELDRFISDPVEVIVNDCVIARGEVVVVDGNYGVRINQLSSREDRLRSGTAEHTHKGGRL